MVKIGQIYYDEEDKDYNLVYKVSDSMVCMYYDYDIKNLKDERRCNKGNLGLNVFKKRMRLINQSDILNDMLEILN